MTSVSRLQVIDMQGIVVFQQALSPDQSGKVIIENSDWAPGLYIISLETREGIFRAKIVK